jgi:hypothetical protein
MEDETRVDGRPSYAELGLNDGSSLFGLVNCVKRKTRGAFLETTV